MVTWHTWRETDGQDVYDMYQNIIERRGKKFRRFLSGGVYEAKKERLMSAVDVKDEKNDIEDSESAFICTNPKVLFIIIH